MSPACPNRQSASSGARPSSPAWPSSACDWPGTVTHESYSYEAGWRGALELLPQKPDAIFFASDILAIGGMDALRREAGIAIPDDIAVAGFDDVAMAAWPAYSLTTYRQPIGALIEATLDLITAEHGEAAHRSIPGELVVRASSVQRAPDGFGASRASDATGLQQGV